MSLGRAARLEDAAGRYIEFCKSTFANDLTLRGMTIVVDGAHGAAYQIAPKVFHELGAATVIGPDNRSQILWIEPGRECGRTHKVAEHDRKLATFS